MTSLGPWSADEIISFFGDDFGSDDTKWPFSRDKILAFEKSDEIAIQSG